MLNYEENLAKLLELTLMKAGLPGDPKKVQGATFVYNFEEHYIIGSITSIGFGPTEGVSLYVSAPRFQGMNIRRLIFSENTWRAQGNEPNESRFGILTLL